MQHEAVTPPPAYPDRRVFRLQHPAFGRPSGTRLTLGLGLLIPIGAAALLAASIAPFDPWLSVAKPFEPPSLIHIFGTDDLGRDLFSAVIAGARTSLAVGLAVAMLTASIGVVIGLVAGFIGGWVDDVLMRLSEIVQILPRFFIAILVAAMIGASIGHLIWVLGLMSWPGLARIVRAETLSLRNRPFVQAAIALGGSQSWIVWRHVLPHASRSIVAVLSLVACAAILTEAGLAYLGLSDPNVISWGRLISNAQSFLYRAWWLSVFPGLAIVITIVAITLIIDGLRRD
ncbi:MAG: ABC transporter permease [Geminicoccales bacterium]